ncbi:MAG: glutamine--fructose-6-phosphate transaminase (isomerizing) [Actinobacteria bacterium]|nr:MAG: glutamine--fructose-6-phosphate transaminase (isomerizing) [Actinomycetota bacterium]
MCGIVGYIGDKHAVNVLMEGLRSLEYRGYDSAGVAVLSGNGTALLRRKGKLAVLQEAIDAEPPCGTIGIGHTRWATHGRPSEENAHPHRDCSGRIIVVHNGIIENFHELRATLQSEGHTFTSQTDTETIAHLVEKYYEDDLAAAVSRALGDVEGSFAVVVLSEEEPERLVAARKDSPLVIGLGEGENIIASDIPALLKYTRDVLVLENGEMADVTSRGVIVTSVNGGGVIERDAMRVTWDANAAEKAGYPDFMLKEIYEQPAAVRETLRGRIGADGSVSLDELALSPEQIRDLDRVYVVACGTSFHAGLVGKQLIESWARVPVDVDVSSEFRYRKPLVDEKTLVIAITQSGETADTLAGVREARSRGGKVLAITNVVGSSVTREADAIVYTHAGPEIGVAATKTFVSQIAALYIVALYLGEERGLMDAEDARAIKAQLLELPAVVEKTLELDEKIAAAAANYVEATDALFLGRGMGMPIAYEGALKLKEISYIHAEGYAAGEMKHGPIALIDNGTPIVVVATKSHVYEKMLSNIQEVMARDGDVIAVATAGNEEIGRHARFVFHIPETSEPLSAIPAVVPLQLFAYHLAKMRGCNVDQPRNLAKSVTVE